MEIAATEGYGIVLVLYSLITYALDSYVVQHEHRKGTNPAVLKCAAECHSATS